MRQSVELRLSEAFQLTALPIFNDNWVWIIYGKGASWAVDPGEAQALLNWCDQHPDYPLQGLLITHKHSDHIGGVNTVLKHFPHLSIWASGYLSWPFEHQAVHDQDTFILNASDASLKVQVLHVPGHTLEHVAYYLPDIPLVFCGDTLFSLGCGRMFEGTPEHFWPALLKLRELPSECLVACAHEYTLSNARFALAVEPDSKDHQQFYQHCLTLQQEERSTLPSKLSVEKQLNPFLKCDEWGIQQRVERWSGQPCSTAYQVFAQLREWKNQF